MRGKKKKNQPQTGEKINPFIIISTNFNETSIT